MAIFSTVCVWPVLGFAWCATGHEVIAQIAYDHLTPQAKQQVDQRVQDLHQAYPAIKTFDEMAAWPDWIKGDSVTAFNEWHYIDLPITFDKTRAPYPPMTQNAVWAIGQSQQILASSNANQYEKTVFLAFLMHITSDLHQPLHAAELYSKQFPRGDLGGNLFIIKTPTKTDLHTFWDHGLGLLPTTYTPTMAQVRTLSKQIEQAYPESDFTDQIQDLQPMNWARQSNTIARRDVYSIKPNAKISKTYIANGQQIVEQQMALAGYRLAAVLNQLYS